LLALIAVPIMVRADNVQNDVVVAGTGTLTAGGSTVVTYTIIGNSAPMGDASGCNVDGANPATVTVSAPSGATATPTSIVFTACGSSGSKPVTFSSNTAGTYTITHAISGGKTGSLWNNQANFLLQVNPPADSTPPVITPNISGTLGTNGWYTSNVTVSWSVIDNESAVSSSSGCSSTTINTDTTGTTLTCTATSAGGTAMQSVTIKRDATAPVVVVTGVTDGATYTLGSVPTAGCSTTDATSGVQINATLSTSGGPVGSITATCSGAKDNAGNTGSKSVMYNVIYNWTGFFSPVDNPPVVNGVTAGQGIPVKFGLGGNQGLSIFVAGYPASQQIACTGGSEDEIEQTVTAGSSSLSYDPATNQYNYVWKTDRSWKGTCRRLTVKLNDGTSHTADFKFK
jgi:hypothetical protein